MTIDNGHDFHAFSALGGSDRLAAARGIGERGVDEAFRLVDPAFVAKRAGQVRQDVLSRLVRQTSSCNKQRASSHLITNNKRFAQLENMHAGFF